jgi:hypothetical protein
MAVNLVRLSHIDISITGYGAIRLMHNKQLSIEWWCGAAGAFREPLMAIGVARTSEKSDNWLKNRILLPGGELTAT